MEYDQEINVADKIVKYHQGDKKNYSCKIEYAHTKCPEIYFSVKTEKGIDEITKRAQMLIESADRHIEKFGHIEIKHKIKYDMRMTITKISYFPDKCWYFRFFKYKFKKGFIFRIFGIDFNLREN